MIDSIISPFICADKPSHISKAHLQKSTSIFCHYYWACNAQVACNWDSHSFSARRCLLSSHSILFSKLNLPFRCFEDDFVMCNTFKFLKQIKGVLNLSGLSTYAPICQNPCFKPGTMDAAFVQWSDKGLIAIIDLYINYHFAPFTQLQTIFGLLSSIFFDTCKSEILLGSWSLSLKCLYNTSFMSLWPNLPPPNAWSLNLSIFLVWQPLLYILKKPGYQMMRFWMRCGPRDWTGSNLALLMLDFNFFSLKSSTGYIFPRPDWIGFLYLWLMQIRWRDSGSPFLFLP